MAKEFTLRKASKIAVRAADIQRANPVNLLMQSITKAIEEADYTFDEISLDMRWFIVNKTFLQTNEKPAVKGHYVRLYGNDDEENDCGVSGICLECFINGKTHHHYNYELWETDLNGDRGECHICKVAIK